MTNKQVLSAPISDEFPDCGTRSKLAIVRADVTEHLEEYLETCNAFYASEGVFPWRVARIENLKFVDI